MAMSQLKKVSALNLKGETAGDQTDSNSKNPGLNYHDFQSFMVQYETLIPELVSPDYLLADRISALKELLAQNSKLLAAVSHQNFIPNDIAQHAPLNQVKEILINSDELINDILNNIEPRFRPQHR
jgi:hypothetical protein